MFILHLLFWSSVGLLVYTHIGYPVLLWTLSRLRPRPARRATTEPPISVVIAAHNEAPRIEEKLRNLLALDYPQDRLEIIIGSDGSTDGTADRARQFEAAG